MSRFLTIAMALLTSACVRAGLQTDVEYARTGGVSLMLDAQTPEGPGPFPACILVHGGSWTTGDKAIYISPLFEPLSKAGFAWFSINYRFAPQHVWPACADDVASAITWVRKHAAEYHVDPHRIVLIGESSGGHLASWAGIADHGSPPLAGVVAFYAPNNFPDFVKSGSEPGTISTLLGVNEDSPDSLKALRDSSPIYRVRPGLPPFLLLHGNMDRIVFYEQSTQFQKVMQNDGNVCDLITVPGGDHGMSSWAPLKPNYRVPLIDWLKEKAK